MFETILVGYDGSGHARDALSLATTLATPDAEVVLCCVHPFQPVAAAVVAGEHGVPGRDEAERRLQAGQERAGSRRVRTIAVAATSAASGLHAVAEDEGVDLLVVGSSHRSAAGRVLLGSTTSQALNAPPCAVAVATAGLEGGGHELRDIVVGFDGGTESKAALAAGAELARTHGARLKLLTVVEPATQALGWAGAYVYPEYREDALTIAREDQEDAIRDLPGDVEVTSEIVEGIAARVLLDVSADADLLVLGSRGYGPIRRVLLGGVSTRVAGATSCPLLVLPRTAAAADADAA